MYDYEEFTWGLTIFLGWSLSSHTSALLNDLEACLAPQNTSEYSGTYEYSSGEAEYTTEEECLDQSIDRALLWVDNVLWTTPEEVQAEVNVLGAGYHALVERIFADSDIDPTSIPEHHHCLDILNNKICICLC